MKLTKLTWGGRSVFATSSGTYYTGASIHRKKSTAQQKSRSLDRRWPDSRVIKHGNRFIVVDRLRNKDAVRQINNKLGRG